MQNLPRQKLVYACWYKWIPVQKAILVVLLHIIAMAYIDKVGTIPGPTGLDKSA